MDAADVDAFLERYRERFRRLIQTIMAEEAGPDPFAYPLSRYRSLADDERAALVRRAGRLARERVDAELAARGAAWIVIAGDRVVADGQDAGTIPSPDAVLALGEPEDLVAFLFEAPLIEELASTSAWSPLRGQDAYPTLPLGIGEPIALVPAADLDTGSHATLLDAALLPADAPSWFEGRHLGEPFLWAPTAASIALRTESGDVLVRRIPIRVVRDWADSPFVRINPIRRALIGRDLLRAFGLQVRLATTEATTSIIAARGD